MTDGARHDFSRPCPLCGAPAGRLAFPYETRWHDQLYRHRACSACRTTYVDPLPSAEVLAGVYNWQGYHQAAYADVDQGRYRRSVLALARHCPPGTARVLDFGCGAGGFLLAARAAGYDCRGVEHDAEVARNASASSGVPVDTLDAVLASGRRFDVIVLRDVLPHLPDPAGTLRALEALLDDGGSFFFDGPLEEGWSLVRSVAGAVKAVRRRAGLDSVGVTPPTMLFRVDASAQRRFFVDRMGYVEASFEVYETGWPYHVPGRRPTSPGEVAKEVAGLLALAAARVGDRVGVHMGNRFSGLYRPAR